MKSINYPGRSLVSDNIDVNRSSGTPNQPLEIHDTYIQGAYPYKAAQDDYRAAGSKPRVAPTTARRRPPPLAASTITRWSALWAMASSSPPDTTTSPPIIVSSPAVMLADGTSIAAQHVGMANGDVNSRQSPMEACTTTPCVTTSSAGRAGLPHAPKQGYRKDQYFPALARRLFQQSVWRPNPSPSTEDNEYQVWLNKMVSAGIAVGPAF